MNKKSIDVESADFFVYLLNMTCFIVTNFNQTSKNEKRIWLITALWKHVIF